MQLPTKRIATTTVSRVRLRSTMWVPPCDAGVKPMPPKPVSRPECIRINPIRAMASRTWRTATTWSTPSGYRACVGHVEDRVHQFRCDPVLRDVSGSTRRPRGFDVLARIGAGHHHDVDVRPLGDDLPRRFEPAAAGHADVHEHHVGLQLGRLAD